jgi:hypothetical protein
MPRRGPAGLRLFLCGRARGRGGAYRAAFGRASTSRASELALDASAHPRRTACGTPALVQRVDRPPLFHHARRYRTVCGVGRRPSSCSRTLSTLRRQRARPPCVRPNLAAPLPRAETRYGGSYRLDVRRRVMAVIPTTSEARRRDLGGGAPDDAIPRPDPSSLPLLGMTPLA